MFQPQPPRQPAERQVGSRATAKPRLYAQPQPQLYEQRQPAMYPAPGTRAPQPRQMRPSRPPAYANYPRPLYLQERPRQAPVARAPQRATPAAVVRPAPATAVRAKPRHEIDPAFLPTMVDYASDKAPGTIVIDTDNRYLYLVMAGGKAKRYGVGVGRPGFEWAGTHQVTRKAEWPGWTPPAEMRARQPGLPVHMEGGPDNPLGARALYLGSTLYRIHGSNQPWTIGHAVSSGCIRMRNEDVIDLYERVGVGTKVVVL
nr:L,D-transpeptidase [Afifella sp. IM 167]